MFCTVTIIFDTQLSISFGAKLFKSMHASVPWLVIKSSYLLAQVPKKMTLQNSSNFPNSMYLHKLFDSHVSRLSA